MLKTRSQTTVLVADDEPSMLALVAGYLRSQGYKVVEASDGDQAWDQACEHLPDLVVLDVMMPGMSGWEVCHKIRETVSLAHTGVVMLTGIGERLNEITSPLYEADTYLDKPFEFSALDDKIVQTLIGRGRPALDSSAKGGPRKTRGGNGHAGSNGVVMSVGTVKAAKAKPKAAKAKPKAAKKKAKKQVARKAKAVAPAKKIAKKAAKKQARKATAKRPSAAAKKRPTKTKSRAAKSKKPSAKGAPTKKKASKAKKRVARAKKA
jgi:DNA-binding response OmpR family regulator